MPKPTNNLVTKSFLTSQLKQLETHRDKNLNKQLNQVKTDLRAEIQASAAQTTHEVTVEIKDEIRQTKAEILGAVADFGKRVQDLETQVTLNTHRIAKYHPAD